MSEDFVTFSFIWPIHISTLERHRFDDELFSPCFRTTHNNTAFEWKLWVCPAGVRYGNIAEYRERSGFFLRFVPGVHSCVQVKYTFFTECRGKLLNKWSRSTSSKLFSEGTSCGYGNRGYLPVGIDNLKSEGFMDGNFLKLVVVIDIPESQFVWDYIIKKKEAEVKETQDNLELNFTGIFKDILTQEVKQKYTRSAATASNITEKKSKFLDFEILTNDGKQIWCHGLVLQQKSPYFSTMIDSKMKESEENKVEFEDFDSETIQEVLCYIYSNKVSEKFDEMDIPSLLNAAQQFFLPGLKLICEKKLIGWLKDENVAEMLIWANLYNLEVLKDLTLNMASENVLSIWQLRKRKNMGFSDDLWEEVLETTEKRMRIFKHLPNYNIL